MKSDVSVEFKEHAITALQRATDRVGSYAQVVDTTQTQLFQLECTRAVVFALLSVRELLGARGDGQ